MEHMAVQQLPVGSSRSVHRLPCRLAVLPEPATLAATLATALAATAVAVAATLAVFPSTSKRSRHLRMCLQRGTKRAATPNSFVSAPSIS